MFELLKFANENNVNVNIKVMDGSYRPLIGEVINIITFSNANNPNIFKSLRTIIICFILTLKTAYIHVQDNKEIHL